jgi:hypothetical protein
MKVMMRLVALAVAAHVDSAAGRFEFQPELFRKRGKDRHVFGPAQFVVVAIALQPRRVEDAPLGVA